MTYINTVNSHRIIAHLIRNICTTHDSDHSVRHESLLWVAEDPRHVHTDSENSDLTQRMSRLISVLLGVHAILLDLSRVGSNHVQASRL